MHHAPAAEFDSTPSPIDLGDVTGDKLSDVVAQGFVDKKPTLRLTASTGASTFAATTSIEPASLGVKLGDLDGDGTLDIMTAIDGHLVAQMARDGGFEQRDLGVSLTNNVLDFAVPPSQTKRRPGYLHVFYSVACDPSCDDGCLDRCFETGCPVCASNADCGDGICAAGSCVADRSRSL